MKIEVEISEKGNKNSRENQQNRILVTDGHCSIIHYHQKLATTANVYE